MKKLVFLCIVAWAVGVAGPSLADHHYENDPDFFTTHEESDIDMPDWRNRPMPRDSRTLHGVFEPDPIGVLRMVSVTGGYSSCIGDPVTPVCVIDTIEACLIRHQDKLCELAEAPFYNGGIGTQSPPDPDNFRLYRILSVWRATEIDLKPGHRLLHPRKVGDVIIEILRLDCSDDWRGCSSRVKPFTYTARKIGPNRWVMIDMFYPRW